MHITHATTFTTPTRYDSPNLTFELGLAQHHSKVLLHNSVLLGKAVEYSDITDVM